VTIFPVKILKIWLEIMLDNREGVKVL
jgi:hypothetical protein